MIIFVYNADSGALNTALDMAHKLLSPRTYRCSLCSITHGVFREREAWKAFRDAMDEDMLFLHRDEFEARFPQRSGMREYPLVLREQAGEVEMLLSAKDIEGLDLDGLMQAIRSR